MSERVRVKVTGLAHNCGRCGADVVPELRDGEPWLSYGPSPVLAESEARRAEAEGRVAGHLAARLAMREEADRSRAERDDMKAERDAALQRAEAAERSLAAAVEVLRQVEWGDTDWESADPAAESCPCCHRAHENAPDKRSKHAPGCALASVLGGGR